MAAPMKRSVYAALLRQAAQQQRPVLGNVTNTLQYLFRHNAHDGVVVRQQGRCAHSLTGVAPTKTNHVLINRISSQNRVPALNRAALPIAIEQARLKSALFDHCNYDHKDQMKEAFDAKFSMASIDKHCKALEEVAKQAQEVLRGHVHDKSTSKINILDVASGPGEPALTLAENFQDATVYSTDINPSMVDATKARVQSLKIENVKALVADMEDLSDFEDGMFDLVTCCFGMMYCEDPEMALHEIHRVLKPGGTLITTFWDNLSIERASDRLLQAASGTMAPPDRITDPMSLAKPRLMETMIEKSQLSLIKVNHGEFPLRLSGCDNSQEDYAFRLVSEPVYPNLVELVESGECPTAIEDAKKEFGNILSGCDWIKKNEEGDMFTVPNRYKLVIARRGYEKCDKKKKNMLRTKKRLNLYPKAKQTQPVSSQEVSEAFDSVLVNAYSQINNGPWQHVVRSVENIIHGHDTSQVRILDFSSGPGEAACITAKRFPRASVVATDVSPSMVDAMKKKIQSLGIRNMRAIVADAQNLSAFQTGTFDVVTCSFGLSFLSDPKKAIDEVHRVLKPGGSFIATVWEGISIEHISDEIMKEVMKGEPAPPRVIDNLSLAQPRKLESIVENSGMSIINVDHDEFSFQLSGLDHQQDDLAFDVVTIPIHPNLLQLEKNGIKPNAIEDARAAFQRIVSEGQLVHVDAQGRMWTGSNRFKVLVARRKYEDTDIGY